MDQRSRPQSTYPGTPPAFAVKARPLERRTTVLLAVLTIAWILSLPAWPSQDGPVHLYYAEVLGQLLGRGHTVYTGAYFIKQLLPPYALYYYSLLLLSNVVPWLLADRLVVCGYIAIFLLGFRYLARAIGPEADRATLVATLLVLNWALGMGFVNYCLSLGFAMWSIGLWLRLPAHRGLRLRALFLGSIVLVTLSHPVPLLLVLAFCALDLAGRWVMGHRASKESGPRSLIHDAITLCVGAFALLYVKAFAASNPLAQRTVVPGSALHKAVMYWLGYLQGKSLALVLGQRPPLLVYRAGLVALLAGALALAALQFRRDRRRRLWTAGDAFFVLSVGLLVLLPWLPSDLSGAYFFPERLSVVVWIFALLAAAGWCPECEDAAQGEKPASELKASRALALSVVAAMACMLFEANELLRPFAEADAAMSRTTLPIGGEPTLFLESAHRPANVGAGPAWNPAYWSGVHLLRANGAVLANGPWLDSPIIPLALQPGRAGANLPPILANSPHALTEALEASAALREPLLSGVQAIVFTPVDPSQSLAPEPVLEGQPQPTDWICRTAAGASWDICERRVDPAPGR